MKKNRSDNISSSFPDANLLKAFSGLLSGSQNSSRNPSQNSKSPSQPTTTNPVPPEVPPGYDNRAFARLIAKHDRISREIDRKYSPPKSPEK